MSRPLLHLGDSDGIGADGPEAVLRSGLPTAKQLGELLNALPAAIYAVDAEGTITYFNDAAAKLWGYRPRLYIDKWYESGRLYSLDGTPLPREQSPMAVALKEGRQVGGNQAIAERLDGSRVPVMAFSAPLYDASGVLFGAVEMAVDASPCQHFEQAAQRLALIVESSDDAIVSKDLNGLIVTWNTGAERLFGYLAEEVIGQSITIIIPPHRREEETRILERIRRGERIDHFETVRQRKDGGLVTISLTVSPVRDGSGKVVGASKIARDITEQKRQQEQIALLAREADHRTRNLLALAEATVHLTQADTAEAMKAAIEGRLRALAHAHTLLAQSRWAGANLRDLVLAELAPYLQDGGPHALVEGPDLMLEQGATQSMAMVLHELSTNAAKYGALSVSSGRVKVEWRFVAWKRLSFRWAESGGPRVEPPTRRGFGTRAIEQMLAGHLNGEANFDWRETGVICEIAFLAGQ
jgi:PAS domain S-box-containing protein